MSEKKKEIFKANSTSKNSTCLNTPPPTQGKLESRRSFLTKQNKLYSAIGINQKTFKKKLLEKKNTLKPTGRDLLLLEQLESYGVLSTAQIRELIFKNINTRTV